MSSAFVDDAQDRAFERLYERNEREVYRYVLGVLRNPAEAEDVTQVTFLNAYRAIRAGAEPQKPQNWLIAIAHNACRSRVRLLMRRPREVPLDEVAELEVAEGERVNVRELVRAIRRLPENQRAALTLREFEGRSYPEIAEALGVTVPAVEALLSRARRAVKRQATVLRGAIAAWQFPSLAAKIAALVAAGAVAGAAGDSAGVSKPLPSHRAIAPAPIPALATVRPPTPVHRPVVHRAARVAPARAHHFVSSATSSPRPAPAPAQPAPPPAPNPPAPPASALAAATPAVPALPQLPEPPALPALPPLPDPPPIPPLPLPQVLPGSGI
jgi:RNA polymerase sigma factor (sigma-70 family)